MNDSDFINKHWDCLNLSSLRPPREILSVTHSDDYTLSGGNRKLFMKVPWTD